MDKLFVFKIASGEECRWGQELGTQVVWGEKDGNPWAGGLCTPGCPGPFPAGSHDPEALLLHRGCDLPPGKPEHRPTSACCSSRNSICGETLPRCLEMLLDYSLTLLSQHAAGDWPCHPCRQDGSGTDQGEGMESLKKPARARPSLTTFWPLGRVWGGLPGNW